MNRRGRILERDKRDFLFSETSSAASGKNGKIHSLLRKETSFVVRALFLSVCLSVSLSLSLWSITSIGYKYCTCP